jgi:hypothetical protein
MQTVSTRAVGWGYLTRLAVFGVVFALLFCWLLRLPLKRNQESFGSGTGLKIQHANSPHPFRSGEWC